MLLWDKTQGKQFTHLDGAYKALYILWWLEILVRKLNCKSGGDKNTTANWNETLAEIWEHGNIAKQSISKKTWHRLQI